VEDLGMRGNLDLEAGQVNVADIVGSDDQSGHGERRVAAFHTDGTDRLYMSEECDDYYELELTPERLDKLIAWLTEQRKAIP
jgi:hypothetical protein